MITYTRYSSVKLIIITPRVQLNTEQWVSLYGQLQVGNKDVQTFKKQQKRQSKQSRYQKIENNLF